MGRQINFFMMPEDVAELDKKIKELGLVIIDDCMPTSSIVVHKSLPETLTHASYFILPNELEKITLTHSENRKEYRVNQMRSPAIEFSHSIIITDTNKMASGRFYYDAMYFDKNNEYISVSDDLKKCNDKLFNWFKRKYQNGYKNGMYICTHAQHWINQNDANLVLDRGVYFLVPQKAEV